MNRVMTLSFELGATVECHAVWTIHAPDGHRFACSGLATITIVTAEDRKSAFTRLSQGVVPCGRADCSLCYETPPDGEPTP